MSEDREELERELAEERARELGYGVPGANPLAGVRAQEDGEEDEDEEEENEEEEERAGVVPVASGDDEPRRDPHTETCPTCNGWGETLTGSRVQAFATRTCPACQGMGYIEIQPEPAPAPSPPAAETGPAPWPEAPPPPVTYAPYQTWQ